MKINNYNIHIIIKLVISYHKDHGEVHVDLHKDILLPFLPTPGITLKVNQKLNFENKESDTLSMPTISVPIKSGRISYFVEEDRFVLYHELPFKDSGQFDITVDDLRRRFGFNFAGDVEDEE